MSAKKGHHASAGTGRETDAIRVSDQEREAAATLLREHAVAGRLSIQELSARLEGTLGARNRGELDAQFQDLPVASPDRRRNHRQAGARGLRIHMHAYLSVSLAMIVIWAMTGTGYFWPLWPILGWGIGIIAHRASCGSVRTTHRMRPDR